MVTHNPFISEATADRIKAIRRRLSATTQLLQDPMVTIEVTARNPADQNRYSTVVATLQLIRIRVRDNQLTEGLVSQGPSESTVRGTFRCWEADGVDLDREQRFDWDGQKCEITEVKPARNGVLNVEFKVLIGPRS